MPDHCTERCSGCGSNKQNHYNFDDLNVLCWHIVIIFDWQIVILLLRLGRLPNFLSASRPGRTAVEGWDLDWLIERTDFEHFSVSG